MQSLSANNSFTPAVLRQAGDGFDVIVSGTFSGTITVQLSKDGSNWYDVDATTVPTVMTGTPATAWYVRAGFKSGAYVSGTAGVGVY